MKKPASNTGASKTVRKLRRVGIRDVAKKAGVSCAAVSRVLNGGPIRISDAKRALILKCAKQLHYVPHAGARRLCRQRTETIGVVFPHAESALGHVYITEMLRHIAEAARRKGYDLLLEFSRDPAAAAADRGRTDGLILVPERDTPPAVFQAWQDAGVPHVVLGGAFAKAKPEFFVDVDVLAGMRSATQYLLDLGHRRIAFLAGIRSPEKQQGFAEALVVAGIRPNPAWSEVCGLEPAGIEKTLDRLLKAPAGERPTAIVAANDELALRIVHALNRRGLHVPADMSVVGFDDVEMAGHSVPALTTMRIPLAEMAERGVQHLLGQVESGNRAQMHCLLPVTLVERESAASPPA